MPSFFWEKNGTWSFAQPVVMRATQEQSSGKQFQTEIQNGYGCVHTAHLHGYIRLTQQYELILNQKLHETYFLKYLSTIVWSEKKMIHASSERQFGRTVQQNFQTIWTFEAYKSWSPNESLMFPSLSRLPKECLRKSDFFFFFFFCYPKNWKYI